MGLNKSIVIKFIITTLVVILISGIFYSSSSYAMGEVISGGKDFLSAGSAATTVIKQDQLKSTSNYIYNTLLAVAIVVAVIVAMVLGIQFMAASADEKAKVKEALIPFVVGCIVVFGSFTIWKVVVEIGNKTEGVIQSESADSDGDGFITPPVKGYICNYCGGEVGNVPYKIVIGGYDWDCESCGKTVITAGDATGATMSE